MMPQEFLHRPVLRWFGLSMLVMLAIFAAITWLAASGREIGWRSGEIILQLLALLPIIWLGWCHIRNRCNLRWILGKGLGNLGMKDLVFLFLLLLPVAFSLDALSLWLWSWIDVAQVEEMLAMPLIPDDSSTTYIFMTLLLAAIVGPLMEELVFRGLLLQRLAVKFGINQAIWTSSALFALLHVDSFLSALLFGLLMSLLYLWTNNLWVPILIHWLNNALVLLWELAWPGGLLQQVSDLRSYSWLWALLLLALVPLVRWMIRSWPDAQSTLPYVVHAHSSG
jgi:membrane protease YdiL (CAAX protease family)